MTSYVREFNFWSQLLSANKKNCWSVCIIIISRGGIFLFGHFCVCDFCILSTAITNPTRWQNSDVVSPHDEPTINPHSPTTAASADQASVIDVENRRLRAIVKYVAT